MLPGKTLYDIRVCIPSFSPFTKAKRSTIPLLHPYKAVQLHAEISIRTDSMQKIGFALQHTVILKCKSNHPTALVPRPVQIIRSPVAMGSKVPACPTCRSRSRWSHPRLKKDKTFPQTESLLTFNLPRNLKREFLTLMQTS
jgi:hypothetical protein